MLNAHPNPQYLCKVLRSNIGWFVSVGRWNWVHADLVQNLLKMHIDMCKVTISKSPYPSQTELARLVYQASPSASVVAPRGDIGFAKVLLCRSVLPFQLLYYTAHCSVRVRNYSPEFIKLERSRLAHLTLTPIKKRFPKISNICV